MDILSIKPNTISLDLKHPGTGAPLGVTLELVSMDSDEVKAVTRQIANANLRAKQAVQTAEKAEGHVVAILSAAIVGWTWSAAATLDGEAKPALNAENKRKLLSVPSISKQVDQALGNEADFFATSASA